MPWQFGPAASGPHASWGPLGLSAIDLPYQLGKIAAGGDICSHVFG
jgi:hypothetical protein